ncbi:GNAT family N-acetyltransferase [Herminiimonas arsenitoxidans]|uniref:GNAT family N-acetyltransferase n=1 Tax=Herminiimonas arsenitoxidans TaxID=1809410 RepID=UPI000970A14B|nr:GNAT family N-acetyltransferase [Herminiimonas arsenitoxidans]
MHNLNVRSARPDEIDRIMALEDCGFHKNIQESKSVMLERMRHFPAGFLVLANDADDAIGYLCSELWESSEALDVSAFALGHDIKDTHHADGKSLYISSMTVSPEYRGSGLGKRFFQQSIAMLRTRLPHLRGSILLLSAEWSGAYKIYQDSSYTEVTRLKDFFAAIAAHDADAIVMQTSFTDDIHNPATQLGKK